MIGNAERASVPERVVRVEIPGPERIVEIPGPERIVEVPVEIIKLVEIPGPERIVNIIGPERIVEKTIEISGPERIVEKEVPVVDITAIRVEKQRVARLQKLNERLRIAVAILSILCIILGAKHG